jgi:transposase
LRRTLKPGALSTVFSLTPGVRLSVDAVAGAGHGGDDPGFAEPFAQCRDGDAHGVGERVGVKVIEVDRPNRQRRRRRGKSDPTDAEAAARAVLAGEATATPKTRSGIVEAIRVLRVARSGAVKARTQAANQLRDLLVTAPEELHAQLYPLSTAKRVAHLVAQQPGRGADPASATRRALCHLARRHPALTAELDALNADLASLTRKAAPRLLARYGVGVETAGVLLVTAGDNPQRLRSDAALAALCGASPVAASSGKTVRVRFSTRPATGLIR